MNTQELKNEVAYFMTRLYQQKLTTTSGGNISFRCDDGTILITPSQTDKGRMTGDEIACMDLDGNIIGKKFKPSIETQMHLNIFKSREDVRAIVHAHPVMASAFAASTAKININYLAESYAMLGNVEYAKYATMGTDELAVIVAKCAKKANCIIMENHGVTAVGKNLLQAFDRLEVLENAAKITLINKSILKENASEISNENLNILNAFI